MVAVVIEARSAVLKEPLSAAEAEIELCVVPFPNATARGCSTDIEAPSASKMHVTVELLSTLCNSAGVVTTTSLVQACAVAISGASSMVSWPGCCLGLLDARRTLVDFTGCDSNESGVHADLCNKPSHIVMKLSISHCDCSCQLR